MVKPFSIFSRKARASSANGKSEEQRDQKIETEGTGEFPEQSDVEKCIEHCVSNLLRNPTDGPISTDQCHDQHDSPLFKLPPEIRSVIWQMTVGDHRTIPLAYLRRRIVGQWDEKTKTSFSRSVPPSLRRDVRRVPNFVAADEETLNRPYLALLVSCRRIYAEIIDLIYSANTFYLGHPESLMELGSLMHPPHLQLIRNLQVDLDYRQPPDRQRIGALRHHQWYAAWPILAHMSGLRHLTVDVGVKYWHMQKRIQHLYSDEWLWTDREADALEPAALIQHVDDFRLRLSWPQGDRPLPGLRAKVERTNDPEGMTATAVPAMSAAAGSVTGVHPGTSGAQDV